MARFEKISEGYPDPVRRSHSLLSWGGNELKCLEGWKRQQKSWLKGKPGELTACNHSLS